MKSDKTPNSSKNRKAFTLIELLVVISIIALLMAILVPALSKAKDIAMCVVCASNVRQLAMSNFLYAGDYGRFAHHGTITGRAPAGVKSEDYVQELLEPYGLPQVGHDVKNPRGIWVCPADKPAKDYPDTYPPLDWWHVYYTKKYGTPRYLSYAYSICGSTDAYTSGYGLTAMGGPPYSRKLEEIERAAITLMFVGGSYPRDWTAWSYVDNCALPTGAFHARGKAANLVACDGHAVTFKDFLEYDVPYEVSGGGEEGNLYYYYLPQYWYRTNASTKLKD